LQDMATRVHWAVASFVSVIVLSMSIIRECKIISNLYCIQLNI
jgi:hypothetical protein